MIKRMKIPSATLRGWSDEKHSEASFYLETGASYANSLTDYIEDTSHVLDIGFTIIQGSAGIHAGWRLLKK
jgi:hypothetical protein